MAHGIEARVPFLDPDVINAYMKIKPEYKMQTKERPEKFILREAFKDDLPDEILWRTKEFQRDSIGQTFARELTILCDKAVPDDEFAFKYLKYPINTPKTKEEMYYRNIFDKYFKSMDKFVHVWEGGSRAGGALWKQFV